MYVRVAPFDWNVHVLILGTCFVSIVKKAQREVNDFQDVCVCVSNPVCVLFVLNQQKCQCFELMTAKPTVTDLVCVYFVTK